MHFFNQPFPHASDFKSRLLTAAGFGIFIFVFLLIFRPFDMGELPLVKIITSSLILGLVTFLCIFVTNYLIEIIFPGIFAEEKWTLGKQMMNVAFVVLLVGTVNYLLFPRLFSMNTGWPNFFKAQAFTFSIGVFPIIIYTLFRQNRWLLKFRLEAALLQQKLDEKKKEPPAINTLVNSAITITSDNEKEKLTIEESRLVYIESASNYVKIYFEHQQKLSFAILRTTMKKVEELLGDNAAMFRCHRAFIVNLDKIEQVEGNAQGYKLKLNGTEERIPVSRNLNKEFADRLLAIRSALHIYPTGNNAGP